MTFAAVFHISLVTDKNQTTLFNICLSISNVITLSLVLSPQTLKTRPDLHDINSNNNSLFILECRGVPSPLSL